MLMACRSRRALLELLLALMLLLLAPLVLLVELLELQEQQVLGRLPERLNSQLVWLRPARRALGQLPRRAHQLLLAWL